MIRKLWVTGLMLLMLAGCAKQDNGWQEGIAKASALPCAITGRLTLDGIDEPIGIVVDRRADGLAVELTDPAELAGLRVDFAEDAARVEYCGLVMNLSQGDIPEQSVFMALEGLFAQLPEQEASITRIGGQLVQNGRVGLSPYAIVWDAEDFKMLKITLDSAGAVIDITDFILS